MMDALLLSLGSMNSKMRLLGQAGFIITKIEKLIYDTTFDLKTGQGRVITNTSIIDKDDFDRTMEILSDVVNNGFSISPYIKIIDEDTVTSDLKIQPGKVGIATMCSITIDGY